MQLATQRNLARAFLRSKEKSCRSSASCLGQRWFSNHEEKEKAALLRALQTDTSQESKLKKGRKPFSNKRGSSDAVSTRGFVGKIPHTTVDRTQPAGQKSKKNKLTFAEFFSDLGESTKTRQNNKGQDNDASLDSSPDQKKPEMTSFFDEVDEIMAKNGSQRGKSRDAIAMTNLGEGENQPPGRRSIFDMFPPETIRSPNAYEEEAYDEYLEILENIMKEKIFLRQHTKKPLSGEKSKVVIDWLKSDEPTIACNLPMLDKAVRHGLPEEEAAQASSTFRSELTAQNEAFKAHHAWDELQYRVAIGALRKIGDICAKTAKATPLDIVWQKLKEVGYKMDKIMLHNFLYVSSTFSVRSSRSLFPTRGRLGGSVLDFLDGGKSKEEKGDDALKAVEAAENEYIDVTSEVAVCHDFLFEPTEQSMSIRVRMLVSQGMPREAEILLDAFAKDDDLRLRTYTPVLSCYVDQGDVPSAFKLYAKMRAGENIVLQPETYIQLISCVAENGFFRDGSEPIEGVKELGYFHASGPLLLNQLASELADNTVEISSASAKRLYNAFQKGYRDSEMAQNLKPLHVLEPLKTNNDHAATNELIVSRVTLDETTGKCPRSGVQLRLINLDDGRKKQLQEGLVYLASTSYEERHQRKNDLAKDSLERFTTWLDKREGHPFTAIIDGPNVGYYMQNFDEGSFNYHQIKFVAEALENMNEKVLITIPEKYTKDSFMVRKPSGNVRQRLTKKEMSIRDELLKSGKLYVVPVSCLDDYYWMFASISDQKRSRKGEDMYLPPGNPEGRWPGIRPMLISNDKMRDHKLSLLEPRLFRRWYSNFIVNFTFSAFAGDRWVDKEIGFSTADFYSREIQGNPSFEDDGKESGTVWHFPVSDWEGNESLCIRIPQYLKSTAR